MIGVEKMRRGGGVVSRYATGVERVQSRVEVHGGGPATQRAFGTVAAVTIVSTPEMATLISWRAPKTLNSASCVAMASALPPARRQAPRRPSPPCSPSTYIVLIEFRNYC